MELSVWIKVSITLFVFIRNAYEVDGLYAGGANVCSYSVRQTQPYQAAVAYTAYVNYRTCCSHFMWCWSRCTKSRAVTRYRLETRYRTYYVTRHSCCNGWTQGAGSTECRIAVCNNPACLHGRCIRPNTCTCNTGYINPSTGCRDDKNECATVNGGCQQECNNYPGGYSCSCRRGFTLYNSNHCRDNDECAVSHGICRCDDAVNNLLCNATCYNTIGSFMCSCSAGYRIIASTRCVDINECLLSNGGCDHLCFNLPGSRRCSCLSGYTLDSNGTSCNDINECRVNNGGCQDQCINKIGSYECRCNNGYILSSNGKTCSDVNECSTVAHGCQHNCNNYKGGFFCTCNHGFKLNADNKTCSDINECSIIKTRLDGTNVTLAGCTQLCHNNVGSFSCGCRTGFKLQQDGKTCHDVNECSGKHDCQQICLNTIGSYSCKCQRGYRLNSNGRSCDGLPCIRLPPIINGNGTCFTGKTNDTCQLRCFVGFELRGSSERRCLPNHKWTGSLTTCRRKTCVSLNPPINGAVLLPCMSYYQASCTLKCKPGYYAIGSTESRCKAAGDSTMYWSNANTVCNKITICSPNPCKHNGICLMVSKTEYKCNCWNTGYKGSTCSEGIIGLPEYPIMHLNTQYNIVFTAKPVNQLVLELSSKTIGLTFHSSSLVFTPNMNSIAVLLQSNQPGLHVIHYSVSGTDAKSFEVPKKSVIYVKERRTSNHSWVGNVINDQGAFTQGCYDSAKLHAKETEKKNDIAIKLHSSAPWYNGVEYEWTDGVIVMAIEGSIIPASVVGSNVSTERIMNNDFDSFVEKYSIDDLEATKKPMSSKDPSTCVSKNPSTKYLTEVVEFNSFTKSVVDSINQRTPYWTNLKTDLSIENFAVSDFVANVYNESKLRQLFPDCGMLLNNDINQPEWYSYVTNQRIALHMAEEELELDSGKQVCIFKDVAKDDVFVGFPQSEKFWSKLKESSGWSGSIKSIEFRNTSQNVTIEVSGKFSTESLYPSSKIKVGVEGKMQLTVKDINQFGSEGISQVLTTKATGMVSFGIHSNSLYSTETFSVSGKGNVLIKHTGVPTKTCPLTNFAVDISSARKPRLSQWLRNVIKVNAGPRIMIKFAVNESGGQVSDAQNHTAFLSIAKEIRNLNKTAADVLKIHFPKGNLSSVGRDIQRAIHLSEELLTLCRLNSGPKLLPPLIELKKTVNVIERKFQVLSIMMKGRKSFDQLYERFKNSINETYDVLKVHLKRESFSSNVGSYILNSSATMCVGDLCFSESSFEIIYGLSGVQLQTCYGVRQRILTRTVIIGSTGEEKTLAGVLKIPRNTRIVYFTSKQGSNIGVFNASVSMYGSKETVEVTVQNNSLSFSAQLTLPDKSSAEFKFSTELSNLKGGGDILLKVAGTLGHNADLIKQLNTYLQNRLAKISNETKTRIDALKKAVDMSNKQQRDSVEYLRKVEKNYAEKIANELRINKEVNATVAVYSQLKLILQKRLNKYDSVVANYTDAIENCAPRICVSKCTPGVVKSICYDDRYTTINIKSCNLVTKNYIKTEFQQVSSPASYVTYETKTNCQTKCPPLTGFFKKVFGRKRRGLVSTVVSKLLQTAAKSAGKGLFSYLGGETGKIGAQIGAMLPGPFGIVGMIVGGIIGSAFGSCDKTCNTKFIPKEILFTKYDVEKIARTVFYRESVCKDTIKQIKSGFSHAHECLYQRNCSELLADVQCLHENQRCYSLRKVLRRKINEEIQLAPVYSNFESQSLKLENLETAKRFAAADRENAHKSLLSAKAMSTEANYTLDLAKQSLANTNTLLSLEIKAEKAVSMYGTESFSVKSGRSLFYVTKSSRIPVSLALDMEVGRENGRKLSSTSIIDFTNVNESIEYASKEIIKKLFGKSQRSRRSLNTDEIADTISVGGLDLNVTRLKCNTIEKSMFYLITILNGFSKGLLHLENMTKEIEKSEELRLNFTRDIHARIMNNSDLCNDVGNFTSDNCSTARLSQMYKNLTKGESTEKNISLSWPAKRIQIISNLEIFTESQNITSCAGVRDCVLHSINTVSDLVKFEKSHLAALCRKDIPVWVSSFSHILNDDSITRDETNKHIQMISDSIKISRPKDIFCDSPPIILSDLPPKVIVPKGKSAVLNFGLVPSIHPTSFVWKKDGVTISSGDDDTLLITGTDKTISGYYNCEVSNKFGKVSTKTANLVYEEKPKIITHPTGVQTTLKSPSSLITLLCNSTGVPMPEISWLFAPFSNESNLTVLNQYKSILQLNSTSSNQSGFYYCKASNTQGYDISRPARVHVLPSKLAEFSIKISFNIYPKTINSSQYETRVPSSLSEEDKSNLTVILSKDMNISTERIDNMRYSNFSNQLAILSFDIKTQNLNELLAASSDWTMISENVVMARKGLLILSLWLYHVYSNVTTDLLIGNSNFTVDASTIDADPLPVKCPSSYSLNSNGFICEMCQSGSRFVSGGGCKLCPVGSYQPEQGQTGCLKCREDFVTSSLGSVHSGDCFLAGLSSTTPKPSTSVSKPKLSTSVPTPKQSVPTSKTTENSTTAPTEIPIPTPDTAITNHTERTLDQPVIKFQESDNGKLSIIIGSSFGGVLLVILILGLLYRKYAQRENKVEGRKNHPKTPNLQETRSNGSGKKSPPQNARKEEKKPVLPDKRGENKVTFSSWSSPEGLSFQNHAYSYGSFGGGCIEESDANIDNGHDFELNEFPRFKKPDVYPYHDLGVEVMPYRPYQKNSNC